MEQLVIAIVLAFAVVAIYSTYLRWKHGDDYEDPKPIKRKTK